MYRSIYRDLVVKPQRKITLGRPRHRWEIILKGIFKNWDGKTMDWLRIGTGGGCL
jgi:hypothetical protein